jgi:elongation factor G
MIRSDVSNATIPEEYIKSVTDGIRLALDDPPMVDIIVRIVGGSSDRSASSDLAFKMAGIFSVKDAIKKAEPMALE